MGHRSGTTPSTEAVRERGDSGADLWLCVQLNYADMLKRVEPLRNELQKLEDDAKDNKTKAEEVEQMIRDLEASIARYKEEYAVLISEAQAIKADLAAVEAKVRLRRSRRLPCGALVFLLVVVFFEQLCVEAQLVD